MAFRIIICGKANTGRTELMIRALSDIRLIAGGYCAVRLEKEDGSAETAVLDPVEAGAAVLPAKLFEGQKRISPESGEFIQLVRKALKQIPGKGFGWLDEILGFELSDEECFEQLSGLLHSEVPVAAVLAPMEHIGNRDRYRELRNYLETDPETCLLDPEKTGQKEAFRILREWAEENLDRYHHSFFDPRMKLRAKRGRPAGVFPPSFT